MEQYKAIFRCARHDCSQKAYQYVCGLLQAEESNISKICEVVVNTSYEALQHFISKSPWSASAVCKQVAEDGQKLLATIRGEMALLLDEYSGRKQGEQSVGVARQYLGCMGKVENGQVAVLAVLSKKIHTVIIAVRLFLPESWTSDAKRMDLAGVPASERGFRAKPDIALDIAKELAQEGVEWDFINADALYGNSTAFRRGIDQLGEYVVFVHCDQTMYLHDPKPAVPERTSEHGRTPSRLKTSAWHGRVDEYVKEQPESAWQTIEYRDGSKGIYRRQVLTRMIWTWDGSEAVAIKERLVVSRRLDKSDVQYSLSNDRDAKHSVYRLAVRQMHRSWVEQAIKDGKQELGMTQYQVRSWQAWEHHIALTMLAFLFITQERILNKRNEPMLSCADIRDLLTAMLPTKLKDERALLDMINERHRRRSSDKERWRRLTLSG